MSTDTILKKEFERLLENLEFLKSYYPPSIEFLSGVQTERKADYKHFSKEDFNCINQQENKFSNILSYITQAIDETQYLIDKT